MSQATVEQLRREIARVRRHHKPRGRHHSPDLRRAVVEHALSQRALGVSLVSTATTLGVAYPTLCQWLHRRDAGFRAVSVRSESPAASLRVITAQGHRVEGLSREDLVDLLRALS